MTIWSTVQASNFVDAVLHDRWFHSANGYFEPFCRVYQGAFCMQQLFPIPLQHSDSMCPYCRVGDLSPELRVQVAEKAGQLKQKRNDSVLKLRKQTMLQDIRGGMSALKQAMCLSFARLGQACKQDCIGEPGTATAAHVVLHSVMVSNTLHGMYCVVCIAWCASHYSICV